MLFNSVAFATFLPAVFLLYWFVFNKNLRWQNLFVIAASYLFYGWWDWRFLGLIVVSSLTDYIVGIQLDRHKNPQTRKKLLWASILVNIGILGFFKYFNFFVGSLVASLASMGITLGATTLRIVLPVGISFYTFQTLSYTIDIYRGKISSIRDPIAFFAFVSFFPQLVAGPIERAANLLPQFLRRRRFTYEEAADGLRQMLWGFFKKVTIADTAGIFVNAIFANYSSLPGSTLFLGAALFGIQIYGDFSGYSDIAIGTGRLFGFNLMTNFRYPYFARDVGEFWRRWHISLSSWFRDYVYIPLGGNIGSGLRRMRNILVTFTVSGLWHGANWTFVTWGALHALYFLPSYLRRAHRKYMDTAAEGKILPTARELLSMAATFIAVSFAWIFFRAETFRDALWYASGIFNTSLFTLPSLTKLGITGTVPFGALLLLSATLFACEWIGRNRRHALDIIATNLPRWGRWTIYLGIATVVAMFGTLNAAEPFIYFQF